MNNTEKRFDIDASLAIKGIAILMMLFHHLFRNGLYVHEKYDITYVPFPEVNVCNIATVCKICVAIFTFISGYGLYLNYKKRGNETGWVLSRGIKLLSSFWFIAILCWIICQIIDGRVQSVYFSKSCYEGIVYMLVELLGCSWLLGTPLFVTEWWYMSAAIVFIFLIPIIFQFEDKLLLLLLMVIAFPRVLGVGYQGGCGIYTFLFGFMLGVFCARNDYVNKWINLYKGKRKLAKFITEFVFLILGYKLYRKIPIDIFWEFHFGLYPLLVILFLTEFIIGIRSIKKILIFFGKHSTNIYLLHSVYLYIYLSEFIYNMPYFLLSYLVLTGISLGSSIFIEWLKKVIKYEKLILYMDNGLVKKCRNI